MFVLGTEHNSDYIVNVEKLYSQMMAKLIASCQYTLLYALPYYMGVYTNFKYEDISDACK